MLKTRGAPRTAVRANRFYAALLKDDLSGRTGEMTAMAQAMYHAFLLKRNDPKLSGLLKRIARDDMRHFELLGETVALLGGNPVYRLGRTQDNWHAGTVRYGRDFAGRLADDLELKEAAIRKYKYHLRRIRDPLVRALIRGILNEEEEHARLLAVAAGRCGGGGSVETGVPKARGKKRRGAARV